ncbi:phosphotransferase [Alisedimentitalea sp. MJ-SS2]|uniref:phosphotransferase n=1 Tax=Aliisedimentitalea sp. MJ-SS2 TaxID=3049795 RepID=UPI0029159849|nr:phosphotransferase [Alisedimentitalea sp. MJ-SS2]MDU8929527.1 phosphotransferase [Alisedimentitalea sp. MJ-SS2]
MLDLAREAAGLWGLGHAHVELAAQRENVVFRVTSPEGYLALRFHRPGYRDAAQLTSELQWMDMLARGGLSVPGPIPAEDGALIQAQGKYLIDMLKWLPGKPLGKAGELRGVTDRADFCHKLGAQMALMHGLSDEWVRPQGFTRPSWDRAGLLGEAPLWGRFWDHPHLSDAERALLLEVRQHADAALAATEPHADFGLIHADLLSENMLFDGTRLSFIDFDDGGFGFRDFELATFLMRYEDASDYAELRAALCEGYATRRKVRLDQLDLFILLRALTYPGWIMDRLGEPGAKERSERAIATAATLARRWLGR